MQFRRRQYWFFSAIFATSALLSIGVGATTPSPSPAAPSLLSVQPSLGLSTLQSLMGPQTSMAQAIEEAEQIDRRPDTVSPVLLYPVSHVFLDQGKVTRASFLFYLGQMRVRAELQGCFLQNPEQEQRWNQLRGELNEVFGPRVNQMAFKNLNELEKTVHEVVQFDAQAPHTKPQGCPLEDRQWEEWRQLNRNQYLQEFLIHLPFIQKAQREKQ